MAPAEAGAIASWNTPQPLVTGTSASDEVWISSQVQWSSYRPS